MGIDTPYNIETILYDFFNEVKQNQFTITNIAQLQWSMGIYEFFKAEPLTFKYKLIKNSIETHPRSLRSKFEHD